MSRRKKYIKLTAEQKSALKKGYKHGKSNLFRRKCQCILLSSEGQSVKQLCDFYQVSSTSIYKWFGLWEQQGIEGLQLKPGRGRKPKLKLEDPKQVETVKTLVANEPKNLNRVVGQLRTELGLELSTKTLKRFLKNLDK